MAAFPPKCACSPPSNPPPKTFDPIRILRQRHPTCGINYVLDIIRNVCVPLPPPPPKCAPGYVLDTETRRCVKIPVTGPPPPPINPVPPGWNSQRWINLLTTAAAAVPCSGNVFETALYAANYAISPYPVSADPTWAPKAFAQVYALVVARCLTIGIKFTFPSTSTFSGIATIFGGITGTAYTNFISVLDTYSPFAIDVTVEM